MMISNENNTCIYSDLDINGTFDIKSFAKQSQIWLNNSWVFATWLPATHGKTASQARIDSRLYEFKRKTGVWEVIDDEN